MRAAAIPLRPPLNASGSTSQHRPTAVKTPRNTNDHRNRTIAGKSSANSARTPHFSSIPEELTQVKRELLHAEVRHAKARAAVSGAEADVKVLNARLKALTK